MEFTLLEPILFSNRLFSLLIPTVCNCIVAEKGASTHATSTRVEPMLSKEVIRVILLKACHRNRIYHLR